MLENPLLKNHPNTESIEWKFLDKDTYVEVENILTDGVKLFNPFMVDNFFSTEDFQELVDLCTSYELSKLDYSNQMNKWEQNLHIPEKFEQLALNKLKSLLDIDDAQIQYTMYAHHQITEDGRIPKLPLHIDWAPGSYMIDLQIGGNRDWGFVAKYENFICKPNQAVICQPQFDYHYRPSWNSTDPKEYYQAIFFHIVNKNHWVVLDGNERSHYLNNKYSFGEEFRNSEVFANFQKQRNLIFEESYIKKIMSINLPQPPWNEIPSSNDTHIHNRKNVKPGI